MYRLAGIVSVIIVMMTSIGCAGPETQASHDGHEAWVTDFEAAKTLAAERKVPILADFSGSDWCGWCIKLDKEVFSKEAFQDYAKDNLVLFLADFPSSKELPAEVVKQNEALAKTYNIRGFPTVLLLDAQGQEVARTGYRRGGAEGYIKHIKELLLKAGTS